MSESTLSLIVILSLFGLALFGTNYLNRKYSPVSEEALKQAKIDCPTISNYVNINKSISIMDLDSAVDECKQVAIQKELLSK